MLIEKIPSAIWSSINTANTYKDYAKHLCDKIINNIKQTAKICYLIITFEDKAI